jgi:hypothetical protein
MTRETIRQGETKTRTWGMNGCCPPCTMHGGHDGSFSSLDAGKHGVCLFGTQLLTLYRHVCYSMLERQTALSPFLSSAPLIWPSQSFLSHSYSYSTMLMFDDRSSVGRKRIRRSCP